MASMFSNVFVCVCVLIALLIQRYIICIYNTQFHKITSPICLCLCPFVSEETYASKYMDCVCILVDGVFWMCIPRRVFFFFFWELGSGGGVGICVGKGRLLALRDDELWVDDDNDHKWGRRCGGVECVCLCMCLICFRSIC